MKNNILLLLFLAISGLSFSQGNDISLYSYYGLGVENVNSYGGYSAMGNTGVGIDSRYQINNFNSSNLANILPNSFLYEIGANTDLTNVSTSEISQYIKNFNFSHITFAFSAGKYWGSSFSLVPYTKKGYTIDLESPLEGSTSTYPTRVEGTGGISKASWNNGFKISENLNIGLDAAFLFGSVIQEDRSYINNTSIFKTNDDRYTGFNYGTSFQYKTDKLIGIRTTLGASITFESFLKGKQVSNVLKSTGAYQYYTLADKKDIADYNLPTRIAVGISSQINDKILLAADYRLNKWSGKGGGSVDNYFKDQTIYSLGMEYRAVKQQYSYWNRIKYRFGMFYDNGNLSLNGIDIKEYGITAGFALPLSNENNSMLNVSYMYGNKGTTDNSLMKETYHKISINLSLEGIWFLKTKIF
ncbi:MAG: hypothetical protein HRT66_12835 [Flavobacteriaceae bacterium]|nr:hypothetical protein [Flavobacteriaceae bacterium]